MSTPVITATTRFGTFTRQTNRTYTHIVARKHAEGDSLLRRGRALSWCGSLALAEVQLRYWRGTLPGVEVEIFPVDGGSR